MVTFQIDLLQEPGNPLTTYDNGFPGSYRRSIWKVTVPPVARPVVVQAQGTGSTIGVALLGSPGGNVAKVGTILLLPYLPLSLKLLNFFSRQQMSYLVH